MAPRDEHHEQACGECGGARWVRSAARVGASGFGRPVRCSSCWNEAELLERARVPVEYREAEAPPNRRLSAALERWWAVSPPDARPSLVLAGPPGSGKTHTAAWMVRRWIGGNGPDPRFVRVPDLLDELRQSIALKNDPGARPAAGYVLEWLASLPLLVLDDLGAERATDWAVERLGVLLEQRLVQRRLTIVTTNLLDPAAVNEALGFRIADRLTSFAWLKMDGRSFRTKRGVEATKQLTGEAPWWAE